MSGVCQRTVDDAVAIAESMGLKCIFPLDNELVIDDDTQDGTIQEVHQKVWDALSHNEIKILDNMTTTSKSGRKHHWYLMDRDLPHMTRIALQACAGSDPVKEVLSAIRLIQGSQEESAIAVFETSVQEARVYKWRRTRTRL